MPDIAYLKGLPEFNAGLARIMAAVDVATATAAGTGAHLVEANIKAKLSLKSHSKRTKTPSAPGEPPATISGNLRRSVAVQGPTRVGWGVYESKVGPTAVYGRIQELGGRTGRNYATYLPPRPYVHPALEESKPAMEALYREAWRVAMRAG